MKDPVLIYTYDSSLKARNADRKSGSNYELACAIERVLSDLLDYKRKEGIKPGSVLLLGRYGFDGDNLERTGLFEYINKTNKVRSVKYPKFDITFMTAHSSKGLGYDDVIVINGKNETYGFPSKVEDDPVLAFVIKGDRSIDYAEERRLFYVAMTRTKNRVFFVAPEANPSEFLLELKHSYKNVKLLGKWNESEPVDYAKKSCPLCGYPMQLKYKRAYGLRLYICTNEPEICGFMTNNYKAGKLAIQKCDSCSDGYLIVKGSNENFFLGCTNYNRDNTGCNKMVSKQNYYRQMGYKMEIPKTEATNIQAMAGFEYSDHEDIRNISLNETKPFMPNKQNENKWKATHGDYVKVVRAGIKSVLYSGIDLNDFVFNVVKALQNISRVKYYGINVLCDVLRGVVSKKISDNKLDKIPEYGVYKELPYEIVRNCIEWMITEHYILRTKGEYPVLHSTYEGLHYSEFITEVRLENLKKYLEQ